MTDRRRVTIHEPGVYLVMLSGSTPFPVQFVASFNAGQSIEVGPGPLLAIAQLRKR